MTKRDQLSTTTGQSLGPLMTEAQTATLLQVRPNTLAVWRLHRRYPLPFLKIGRMVRYRREDVMRFAEGQVGGR